MERLTQQVHELTTEESHPPMTIGHQRELCEKIRRLQPQHLMGLLKIVKNYAEPDKEEIEFDLEKLPSRVL